MADDEPPGKPPEEDLRGDDYEFNPKVEPKSSKTWLNMLDESEEAFDDWHDRCDNIDKMYANLMRLADNVRDKQFQMFWANCEVIKPSIYAKPPVPVVVPKFKDRRPVYQASSEIAERCATVAFDLTRINDLMLLVRDDVAMRSRGVAWCRYEGEGSGYDQERVCIDFKNRRDFLHSVSRNWREVTWVAGASYLTRGEARKRFRESSGDAYRDAEYAVNRDSKSIGGADSRQRAKFWEIWSKSEKRVLWVTKGCDKILDEEEPHLRLTNFFPCPKPAYGTVQPGSLVPVPDVMQYRDQLEEINLLTSRIHALSDALEAKGFYPSGGTELSDAVQAAVAHKSPGRLLVPIANWAAFGGTKEIVVWLPIDMIAQTITGLVALRKQIIEDIYQIMGLSDIMRGATDPNETLGAQQLKTQYGSTRIRDKQAEMVRLARDLVEITVEIIFQKFNPVTIIEMSQTELPTMQMVQQQVGQIMQQMQQQRMQAMQIAANPQMQQMAMQKPEMAQQALQQVQQAEATAQAHITQLQEKPTIEQVLHFLSSNRSRVFVLDIETDSTIQIDEQAEKKQRGEFVGMMSSLLPQLAAMVGAEPKTAPFAGEMLKFSVAPFRAGRSMDGAINELVELLKQKGSQPQPNPEADKIAALKEVEMAKIEQKKQSDLADLKVKQDELIQKDRHHQEQMKNERLIAAGNLNAKAADGEAKAEVQQQKLVENREAHQAHMFEKAQDLELNAQKAQMAATAAQNKQTDMAAKADERRAQQQFKMSQPPRSGA
jgi:hypothetical protein